MNVTKIMTDLLKAVEKKKTNDYLYGMDDYYIYLSVKGHRIFKIEKDCFLIDLYKALPKASPLNNMGQFFKDERHEDAWKTDEIKRKDKITIVKIASKNSQAWIDEKYLKEFDSDCTFKIYNPKSPVFVYENEVQVGVILPVFIKEEVNND